jgi:hypothetical protein
LTLRLASGAATEYAATTDASGFFTVTAPAPGTYSYRVKNPQTLANGGGAVLTSGNNAVEMGLLLEGDANNDNCVRVTDFNLLKVSYGRSVGEPGYDPRADFNGDNTVSVLDFNLLKLNYSQCGAQPVSPGRQIGYHSPGTAIPDPNAGPSVIQVSQPLEDAQCEPLSFQPRAECG